MTRIWSPTLFARSIIIFQGVLTKFNFSMKFPHLEKIVDLMKDLKCEHQSTFPLWGRVKLNFSDRYGKPNIYSKNSSHYQVFSPNFQKLSLWCKKKNHYPSRWICMTHIWFPTLFPRGIIIFQGVLTKLPFLTKFPHLEKLSIQWRTWNMNTKALFPCGGGWHLILGIDIDRKLNIFF